MEANYQGKTVQVPVVVNSTISPAAVTSDLSAFVDIPITVDFGGNTLLNIKNGTAILAQGNDYTLSGNTVSISKNYLATLSVGIYTLTFNFGTGNPATLTMTVVKRYF